MNESLLKHFRGIVRIRCLAVIIRNERMLLINHSGLNNANTYWMPPGGGVEARESVEDCLRRELAEETGLESLNNSFLTAYEFTNEYLHAIELFFKVEPREYNPALGKDPEFDEANQMLTELKWMTKKEIIEMEGELIHPIVQELAQLLI